MHPSACKVAQQASASLLLPLQQESRAKETITALKGELDGLTTLVEAGPERDHEEQIARLMVEKEELLSERDAQVRALP